MIRESKKPLLDEHEQQEEAAQTGRDNTAHSEYVAEMGASYQGNRPRTGSTLSIDSLKNVKSYNVWGYLWVLSLVLIICGFLPWGIIELHRHKQATYVQAWFAAGVFVALAVPLTLWDIAMHLRYWHNPVLQKHIVRIMLMVPIYAVDSWLALRYPDAALYIDTARETYEAYVIYNFYVYLLAFLRQRKDFDIDIHKRPPYPHIFPMCCLKPWRMGQTFINACTHGVASYVVIRLLTTMCSFLTGVFGAYGDGEIDANKSYVYLACINSLSQMWAMYCLVLMYYAFKKDLQPINPLPKFLAIKAIVFFSFWQAVLVAILVSAGVIRSRSNWTYTTEHIAAGIQDFLVCVEMFIAALVHHRVFSYREHLPADNSDPPPITLIAAVRNLLDIRDVAYTVRDHVATVVTLGKSQASNEHTALLGTPSVLTALPSDQKADFGSISSA